MTIAIMSVKAQNWSLLNALVSSHKSSTNAGRTLENFLDSQLDKELLPFISAAF